MRTTPTPNRARAPRSPYAGVPGAAPSQPRTARASASRAGARDASVATPRRVSLVERQATYASGAKPVGPASAAASPASARAADVARRGRIPAARHFRDAEPPDARSPTASRADPPPASPEDRVGRPFRFLLGRDADADADDAGPSSPPPLAELSPVKCASPRRSNSPSRSPSPSRAGTRTRRRARSPSSPVRASSPEPRRASSPGARKVGTPAGTSRLHDAHALQERLFASEDARRVVEAKAARAAERARVMEAILAEQNALLEGVPTVIAAGGTEAWRARAATGYGAEADGARWSSSFARDRSRAVSVVPGEDAPAMASLARRVADLESALAERDAEAAAAREAREDLLAEHAAFEADVADIRRDAETARRAAAESSERARISAERERAALDAVGGESARADAAEAEMATLTKQADIMAAQLEVASLRLDVLVREQREEDVAEDDAATGKDDAATGKDGAATGARDPTEPSADAEIRRHGLAARLQRVERDYARMVRETSSFVAARRDSEERLKSAVETASGRRGARRRSRRNSRRPVSRRRRTTPRSPIARARARRPPRPPRRSARRFAPSRNLARQRSARRSLPATPRSSTSGAPGTPPPTPRARAPETSTRSAPNATNSRVAPRRTSRRSANDRRRARNPATPRRRRRSRVARRNSRRVSKTNDDVSSRRTRRAKTNFGRRWID